MFLVELKAAAIDVVAEAAASAGIDVVLAANDVRPLDRASISTRSCSSLSREPVAG